MCKPSGPQPGFLPSRWGGQQGSVSVPLQAFRGADVRLRRGRQQFERTSESMEQKRDISMLGRYCNCITKRFKLFTRVVYRADLCPLRCRDL